MRRKKRNMGEMRASALRTGGQKGVGRKGKGEEGHCRILKKETTEAGGK